MEKNSQEKQIDVEIAKRKKKKLKRKINFSFLKYVLLLFVLIFILFYSPLFLIREIRINNLKYIDEDNIVFEFEELLGENFFLADLSALRQEVVKNYSFIQNIYTEKVFPNSLVIHIREKSPFVFLNNEQGCFLLDNVAFVLLQGDCVDLGTNYSAVEVVGEDLNNIEFVVNTQSNFYNVEKIDKILEVLNYYDLNVKLVTINGQSGEFVLFDDSVIVFSFVEGVDTQLKRFIIVREKMEVEGLLFETLDLRYERPVLTER